jgi:hypothetical protein
VVGLTINADSEEARNLAKCIVRRLTGDPEADPPRLDPGPAGPFRVLADTGTDDPWDSAERQRDECATELGISEPWELVSVPRP